MEAEQPKRIALTQVGTVAPEPKKPKLPKTHRFDLPLSDSNDKTCPEFSYLELLKSTLPENPENDEDDPFSKHDRAEEQKLMALAHSFEQKYGTGGVGVKKPKRKHYDPLEDLLDLGDGYDHTDPFVDNSEAYDELVPSCLTTKHGGFYINSGVLDFKEVVSDESADILNEMPRKKKKKFAINSDSESEAGTGAERGTEVHIRKRGRPKKMRSEEDLMKELLKEKKKRKKLGSSSSDVHGDKIPKKRKLEKEKLKLLKKKKKLSPTVADLLSQPGTTPTQAPGTIPIPSTQNGLPSTDRVMPNLTAVTGPQINSNNKIADRGKSTGEAVDDSCQISKSLDNLDSIIDSVICHTDGPGSGNSADSRSRSPGPVTSTEQRIDTKLPHNLPPSLQGTLEELKKEALVPNQGKCKFFGPKVNRLLLLVENQSRQLGSSTRSSIYNHLAAHLPCGKETLVKRAKKLTLDQHDNKLKEPIARLKEAIQTVMPPLIDKHQADCIAAQLAKQDRLHSDIQQQCMSSDSDEESEKPPDGEKHKRIMAPRKKFEWNTQIKALLNEVVRLKMEHYDQSKVRSQAPDEFLRSFLEQEIKGLWPQGWMQTRMLFKESRSIHNKWTGLVIKAKKLGITPTTTPTTNKSTTLTSAVMNPLSSVASSSTVPVLTPQQVNSPGGSSDGSPVLRKEDIPMPKPSRARSPSPSRAQSSSAISRTPPKLDYMGTAPDSTSSTEKIKVVNKTKPMLKSAESSGFNPNLVGYSTVEKEVSKCSSSPYLSEANKITPSNSTPVGQSKSDHSASSAVMTSNMNFMEKFREFATLHQEQVEKTNPNSRVADVGAPATQPGRPLLAAAMSGAPFSYSSSASTSQQLLRANATSVSHNTKTGVTSSTSKSDKTMNKLNPNRGTMQLQDVSFQNKAAADLVHSTTNTSLQGLQSQKSPSSAPYTTQGHVNRPSQVSSSTLKAPGVGPSFVTNKSPKTSAISTSITSMSMSGQQVAQRVAAAVQKAANSSHATNPIPSAMYPHFNTSPAVGVNKTSSASELTTKASKTVVSSQPQKSLVSPGVTGNSHRVSPTSTVPRSIIAPISRISTQVTHSSSSQQSAQFQHKSSVSSNAAQLQQKTAHRLTSTHSSIQESPTSLLSSSAYTSGPKGAQNLVGAAMQSTVSTTKTRPPVSPPISMAAAPQPTVSKAQLKSSAHKTVTQSPHVTTAHQIYSNLSITQIQAEAVANKAKQQQTRIQQQQGYSKNSMSSAHNTPTSPLMDMGFSLSQIQAASAGTAGYSQSPANLYGSGSGTGTPSSSSMLHGYSGLSKMSPPPLSHPKTPPHNVPQINRSPDVMQGNSLYRGSPSMGPRGSPLPAQNSQSPFGSIHGTPHLPLPPNSLNFGQHPYGDISQNQHRY